MKLIHDGHKVLHMVESKVKCYTRNSVFEGTKEQCEEEIERLSLTFPTSNIEVPASLITGLVDAGMIKLNELPADIKKQAETAITEAQKITPIKITPPVEGEITTIR
jgi:hypothetical protein